MSTKEKVTFVIDAQDKAGAKFRKNREELARTSNQIKVMGENTKVSTELVGSLAATLGGSVFGSFAGEVATITDRIKAMGEVAKTSRAAMIALKLGIAGAAVALTVKLGKAIAGYLSGAEKMRVKTEAALRSIRETDDYLQSRDNKTFDFKLQKIDLLGDPQKQEAAQKKLLATTKDNLKEIAQARQRAEDRFLSLKGDVSIIGTQSAGHKKRIAEAEAMFQRLDMQAKSLREQRDRLQDILGPEKELQAIRDRNAKALADEAKKQQMVKAGIDAATQAFVKRVNLIKKERELQAKAAKEAARQQKQLNRDKERSLDRIADIQAKMNERSGLGAVAGANTAVSSRFSSGRSIQKDHTKIAADEAIKHTKIMEDLRDRLDEENRILKQIRDKELTIGVAK